MKSKRIEDRKLLDTYHDRPCVICGRTPSDPDHIITRKAGGDDVDSNLWPLCRIDHIARHKLGLTEITRRYPKLVPILESKGFTLVILGSVSRWKKS
jgi:5-methylcytosine-specific restriction endonuclease McrA